MAESFTRSTERQFAAPVIEFSLGETAQRQYPYLSECLGIMSSVRSCLVELRQNQKSIATNPNIQALEDMLSPTALGSPYGIMLSRFDLIGELEDLLGINNHQVREWAQEARRVLGSLQTNEWRALPPDDQYFATSHIEEFTMRVMEQTFGPRERWSGRFK